MVPSVCPRMSAAGEMPDAEHKKDLIMCVRQTTYHDFHFRFAVTCRSVQNIFCDAPNFGATRAVYLALSPLSRSHSHIDHRGTNFVVGAGSPPSISLSCASRVAVYLHSVRCAARPAAALPRSSPRSTTRRDAHERSLLRLMRARLARVRRPRPERARPPRRGSSPPRP